MSTGQVSLLFIESTGLVSTLLSTFGVSDIQRFGIDSIQDKKPLKWAIITQNMNVDLHGRALDTPTGPIVTTRSFK